MFSLPCGAIIQTKGVPLARPIKAHKGRQFRGLGRHVHKDFFLLWVDFAFFFAGSSKNAWLSFGEGIIV